jgi:hypothetical protein
MLKLQRWVQQGLLDLNILLELLLRQRLHLLKPEWSYYRYLLYGRQHLLLELLLELHLKDRNYTVYSI